MKLLHHPHSTNGDPLAPVVGRSLAVKDDGYVRLADAAGATWFRTTAPMP